MRASHKLYWPDGTPDRTVEHALKHLKHIERSIDVTPRHRTVLQAGGNMGLWPRRYAEVFQRVVTWEPNAVARECLVANTRKIPKIEVRAEALGAGLGRCGITTRGLGSHNIRAGEDVDMVTLDSTGIEEVDLIQLDVEGYELQILRGAWRMLKERHPVLQLEMRGKGQLERYGNTEEALRAFLDDLGYEELERVGPDRIFKHPGYGDDE